MTISVVCTTNDKSQLVNGTAYMNFKEATDILFDRVGHEEMADALGVSVAAIRQARLSVSAKAYRQPPPNWEKVVVRLAQKRAIHYKQLVEKIESMQRVRDQ